MSPPPIWMHIIVYIYSSIKDKTKPISPAIFSVRFQFIGNFLKLCTIVSGTLKTLTFALFKVLYASHMHPGTWPAFCTQMSVVCGTPLLHTSLVPNRLPMALLRVWGEGGRRDRTEERWRCEWRKHNVYTLRNATLQSLFLLKFLALPVRLPYFVYFSWVSECSLKFHFFFSTE